MRVSIIAPIYNTEKYLRECIDSILAQTYTDFELLLVNDGSTDKSGEICDEYAEKDSRIRVFHQLNSGPSAARNLGLEYAKGEWISFVDSDDYVGINFLNIFNNDYSEEVLFFSPIQVFEDGNTLCRKSIPISVIGREKLENKIYTLKYGSVEDIFGWTVAKFYRKSIIDEYNIRFVETLVFREDEIFTMDYFKHIQSMRILDEPLYYYRIRKTGLTAHGMLDSDYMRLPENIERNLPFFKNEKLIAKEKQRIADYHIEAFIRKKRIWNMYKTMSEVYDFFIQKPQYRDYATNQQIVRILSHTKIVSFLLLEVRQLLEILQRKI